MSLYPFRTVNSRTCGGVGSQSEPSLGVKLVRQTDDNLHLILLNHCFTHIIGLIMTGIGYEHVYLNLRGMIAVNSIFGQ